MQTGNGNARGARGATNLMQFLKTAFWVILAVAIALFCKANHRPLDIKLWGDLVWSTKIWFPIVLAFALGALPVWAVGRAARWRLQKRLESTERALASAIGSSPPPPAAPAPALLPHSAPSEETVS
jgi:putative membrane protein